MLGIRILPKIKLQDLIKVLNADVVKYNSCIEMNFCIDYDIVYDDCWLGKMSDRDNPRKAVYWYGLLPNGSYAYDYTKLEDFIEAKISMRDVIEKATWYSLDGCGIEERLPDYLNGYPKNPKRSAPIF